MEEYDFKDLSVLVNTADLLEAVAGSDYTQGAEPVRQHLKAVNSQDSAEDP